MNLESCTFGEPTVPVYIMPRFARLSARKVFIWSVFCFFMGNVMPIELEVYGNQIRQVFDNDGVYFVFPAFGERRIMFGDRLLPEEVVVNQEKISRPFDIEYGHLRGELRLVSDIFREDILDRVRDDFKLREMNGVMILDSSLVNVRPREYGAKLVSGRLEKVKYSLCKFEKTGSVIFA